MPRPLSETARTKAIGAAVALLGEHGIDGFSVDEVARRSGVAKSTLYRHWGSVNELLVSALDCHVERIPTPDTGSLGDDLTALFDGMRTVVEPAGNRHLLLDTLAAAARDPELARVQEAMLRERMRPIREIVARGVERGEIPPVDLDLASLFVHGPFMARFLLRADPVDPEEISPMVDLLVRGLGGPAGRGSGRCDRPSGPG
jgi:AcrR family transcriptional regulator